MKLFLRSVAIVAAAVLFSATDSSAQAVVYDLVANAPQTINVDLVITEMRMVNVAQTYLGPNGETLIRYVPTMVASPVNGGPFQLTPTYQNFQMPGMPPMSMYVGHKFTVTISRTGMYNFTGTYRDAAGVLRGVPITSTLRP